MKLGLLTAAFRDLTLEQVAAWAAGERLPGARDRVLAGLGRRARRYAGVTHIDVDSFDPDEVHGIDGAARRLTISALAYYPNNLHPDDERARGGERRTCAR